MSRFADNIVCLAETESKLEVLLMARIHYWQMISTWKFIRIKRNVSDFFHCRGAFWIRGSIHYFQTFLLIT